MTLDTTGWQRLATREVRAGTILGNATSMGSTRRLVPRSTISSSGLTMQPGNYKALLTEIRHHFASAFEVDAQYTFSRAMDDGSFDYFIGDYPFDRRHEYGPADYDATHSFKLWGVWSPRIFHGERSWLEKVVEDGRSVESGTGTGISLDSFVQRPGG